MAKNELQILLSLKDNASKELKNFQSKIKGMSPAFKKMALIGGAAFTGLALGVNKSVQAASKAQETFNKFDVVFGDVKDEADSVSKNLQKNFGLAESTVKDLLSATGDMLTGFGMTGEQALDLADKTNQLAVDLASFTNIEGGAERASKALTKALLGERESVKELGIAILEKDVKAKIEAMEVTGRFTDETDRQKKAIATLEIAMSQSKNAIGDYARTQDSLANQQRLLKERTKEMSEQFGAVFLPILNDLVKKIVPIVDKISDWVKENPELVKTIVLVTGALAGLVAVAGIFGVIMATITLPAVLFAAALVSVFAIVVLLREKISAFVHKVLESELAVQLKYLANVAITALMKQLKSLWDKFKELWDLISPVVIPTLKILVAIFGLAIVGAIGALVIAIGTLMEIFKMLISVIKWVIEKAIWFFNDMLDAWRTTLDVIPRVWKSVWDAVGNTLTSAWEGIKATVKGGINWVIDKLNFFIRRANAITQKMNIIGVNVPLIPEIPKLAKGGIVQKPTVAMVGENGPEAVIPLSRRNGIGGVTVNINGGYYFSDEAAEELGNKIIDNLKLQLAI